MFISRIRANGDRSAYGDFWFSPIASRTSSGVGVSADTAMCLSAVFRAVGLVSGHMAMLPMSLYHKGTREKVSHPLLRLLNVRPNRWQNAFEWREMMQGHLELRGNAYNEISSNSKGEITELLPRHPDRVKVQVLESGDRRYTVTDLNGLSRTVAQGAMWHLRGLSSNGITGLSVIEYARESFGLGLAAQSYGARFFANDAKPSGGWLEFPGQFKDKTARQVFRESVQEAQSAANRGKLMVLDQGMKYHEVGLTNEDAQFLETRQFQIADVARWFGVPPHKIGDLSRATFSNIEQMALEYIQDALQPRASRLEASIEADLLFDDEELDVEFEFHEMLRGDSAARAIYYHNGILDGWLTRNEARDMEGREPVEGLDTPLVPLNMSGGSMDPGDVPTETDSEPPVIDPIPPASPKKPKRLADAGASVDLSTDDRLRALLTANAERLARRFAKSGLIDEVLIAEAMAVPQARVVEWLSGLEVGLPEEAIAASLIELGLHP